MKRVKQLALMLLASLLAQCVWAAGGVISINFNAGQGNATADSGMVKVPADAWMNVTAASNNRAGNNMKYWNGTETVDGSSDMYITWAGNDNWKFTDGVTDPILKGYIDDGQNTTVSITNLPFDKYDVYLICATDTENATFNKWTVNETDYSGYGTGSSAWGRSRNSVCERGINVIKVSGQTGDLSVTGAGKSGTVRGTIAAIQVVENTDAELADADFLFKGNTRTFSNATGSTWFNSWGGETLGTGYMAVGPGDMGLVSVAYGSKKLQPYKGFTFPNAFTFAIYTDLSLIKNPADNKKQILWAIGDGNSAGNGMIILSRKGDKVVLDATGSDSVEASMPTDGGYHLYTVTLSSAGIALAIDDGTPVTHAGTYNVAQNGFQVASIFGSMVSGYEKPDVLPIAALVGYSKALTADEIKTLAKRYPATHTACAAKPGNEATAYTFSANGGEVYAGTMNQLTYMRVDRGTLIVPAGQTYKVVAARFGNAQGESQNFGLELDGTMVMTGTSTSSGSGSNGIRANVLADVGGILFGEWEGIGTFNIRGTLDASKAWCQLALDANAQTYNVSGTWTAKGIQANKGSKTRTSHAINLTDGGELVSAAALNNGVLVADIADGCVLETTYSADTNMTSADFSKITGSGTLKFSGNKYALLPTDSTKYFADTLVVENNLENGLIFPVSATIGSLSGSGNLRYDWNDGARTLTIKQAKDTTWSGGIYNSSGHSASSRALDIVVTSENEKTLTVSGTVNGATSTLTAGDGGMIKITGSCTGTGVVLDGGKLQSTGANSAHGMMVKSLKLLQDGTYEWVDGSSTQIGIGANAQVSTLDLNSHKITFTGKGTDQYDRVYLDKTTIASAGTIEVTKGRLFIHCTVPTFPEDTKIVIGENATIEVAGEITDKTMTVTELEYNGTVAAPANEAPTMVVTSKFSGTGSIPKLTLGDGAEVSGSATVTTTATAQGTVKLMSGTLTVPTAFAANTVVSGDETKLAKLEGMTYSLWDGVAKIGTTPYATVQDAIDHLAEGQTAADIVIVDATADIPSGYAKVTTGDVVTLRQAGEVYYVQGYFTTGADQNPLELVTANDGSTTFLDGDTIIVGSKTSNTEAWFSADAKLTKLQFSKDFTMHAGTTDAILNDATITVDEGKVLTISPDRANTKLGAVTINGEVAVSGTTPLAFASVSGTCTITLADGKEITIGTKTGTVTIASGVVNKRVVETEVTGGIKYSLETIQPEPPTPTTEGIVPSIPGAETIVITDAEGATVEGGKIPLATGVYTVKGKVGETVVATETIAVVKAKDAETTTKPVTVAVAVPFKGATVANLLNTALLKEDDELKALNPATKKYQAWTLTAEKTWSPITTVTADGNEAASAAAATTLKRGAAVWVTTTGKVVAFGTYDSTAVEPEVTSGYNLIGNPMMTAITPAAKTVGDVLIPVGTSARYTVIDKGNGAKAWQCSESVQKGTIPGTNIPVFGEVVGEKNPTVEVGGSVWLIKE